MKKVGDDPVPHVRVSEGVLAPNDILFFASDALAAWLLRRAERGEPAWKRLARWASGPRGLRGPVAQCTRRRERATTTWTLVRLTGGPAGREARLAQMATWPDLTEYHEALQHRSDRLAMPSCRRPRSTRPLRDAQAGDRRERGRVQGHRGAERLGGAVLSCGRSRTMPSATAAISQASAEDRSAHSTKFFYLADGLGSKAAPFRS